MIISAEKKRKFRFPIISIVLILLSFIVCSGILYPKVDEFNKNEIKRKKAESEVVASKKLIAKIEAKKKEPVYITLPGATKVRAIVDDYNLNSSVWVLANKTNPLSIDYAPSPIKIPDVKTRTDKSDTERSVRSDIETPLKNMFTAAENDGNYLMIGSGYRPASLQAVYFNSLAASVGETVANQTIARPGQSEHQTGLAVDISTVSRECYLQECFDSTADGVWLADNSYKYGFILRYPKGKELITGYSYEPWHFRYLGVELATAIHDSGLTYEEAWPYLQKALATLKTNRAL